MGVSTTHGINLSMWILIYSFSDTYYVWAACAYTKGVKGKLKLSINLASKGHNKGIEARKPGVACAYSCLIT